MTINDEIQKIIDEVNRLNHKIEMVSNVKSGKEATVYKVLLDDKLVAMKVYKKPEERSFKNTEQYLMGKYYKKPSERKAVAKGNKFAKKLKHQNWVRREYFMLEKLYELGAKIPKPVLHVENAIFMEFLGNQDFVAPRLYDVSLAKNEAENAYKKVLDTMIVFWNFGIVHADLSEYNILWWNNEPYIIDFPQALDKKANPNADEILDRDLRNITKFFGKFIKTDFDEIKKAFS
jgi:RIO kinase 1